MQDETTSQSTSAETGAGGNETTPSLPSLSAMELQHDENQGASEPIPEANDDDSSGNSPENDEHPHSADYDSAYGDSEFESETATLASDILKYREENGRTYHSYGSTEYWGPNDEEAKDQQDLSHHFFTLLLEDQFFFAPVKNPQGILDLGTGTGIWVMDVADRYPSAEVKGIDLSPIQPRWTPPNAHFEVDDYNVPEWNITERYDLIHERELLGSVLNWPQFFLQCYQALKPGGWMDCAEPDIVVTSHRVKLPDDYPAKRWAELFREVGAKSGMTFEPALRLKGWLEGAGFVNVKEKVFQVPVGTWPVDSKQKNLGLWNQVRLAKGMRDFTERRMRNFMGWNDDEIAMLIARTRASVSNSRLCTHQDIYFVCGQKPEH